MEYESDESARVLVKGQWFSAIEVFFHIFFCLVSLYIIVLQFFCSPIVFWSWKTIIIHQFDRLHKNKWKKFLSKQQTKCSMVAIIFLNF